MGTWQALKVRRRTNSAVKGNFSPFSLFSSMAIATPEIREPDKISETIENA